MTSYLLWALALASATYATHARWNRTSLPVWRKGWVERHAYSVATFFLGVAILLVVVGVDVR